MRAYEPLEAPLTFWSRNYEEETKSTGVTVGVGSGAMRVIKAAFSLQAESHKSVIPHKINNDLGSPASDRTSL